MLPSRSQPSTPVQHRPSQPNIHSSTLAFPPFNEETTNLQQEEVEEIPRNELYKHDAAYHGGSAYLSEQDFVFNQPKLGAESHEMLLMNFDRFTCGILSVRNGPNENPWRTMVWPMASRSPVLFHAIAALSAFHKSTTRPEMKACGLEHMNKSIASLKTGVEQTPVLVGLATTLVLGFAECWDSHIRAGITHLRPGKYLVIKALTAVRQRRIVDRGAVALIKFLCNTWLYMDVLARLAGTDTEDRTEIDAELWSSIDQQGTSEEIDPLMGCAATLFPIIGRVGNLVRRVRSSPTNGLSVVSYGNELKQELEQWTPPDFLNKPEDPACDVSHSVQTAEAYRWATLLYLHQAVPEIPCWDSGQLAKKVLMYLATVPLHSRTIIVHIYPLLAAGCEASDKEDRDWVSDRWRSMSQRMQIGNVDKCFEVTREVWRRRDRAQEERANLRRSSLTLPMGSSAFPPGMSGVARTDRYDTASPSAWGSVIHEHGYLKQENVGTRPSVPFPEQMSMSPLETHYQSPPFPEPINLSRFESRQQSMPIPESTGMSPVEGHQLPFPYTERPHEPGIPMRRSSTRSSMSHSRRESTERKDDFDIEQGVKGSQHWVGVMRDWDWESMQRIFSVTSESTNDIGSTSRLTNSRWRIPWDVHLLAGRRYRVGDLTGFASFTYTPYVCRFLLHGLTASLFVWDGCGGVSKMAVSMPALLSLFLTLCRRRQQLRYLFQGTSTNIFILLLCSHAVDALYPCVFDNTSAFGLVPETQDVEVGDLDMVCSSEVCVIVCTGKTRYSERVCGKRGWIRVSTDPLRRSKDSYHRKKQKAKIKTKKKKNTF